MGEMTDTEKLYNILSNKLTWLTEYGEEVYLAAKEDIRSAIQEAEKTFDTAGNTGRRGAITSQSWIRHNGNYFPEGCRTGYHAQMRSRK